MKEAFQRGFDELPFYLKWANYPQFKFSRHPRLQRLMWKVSRRVSFGKRYGPFGSLAARPFHALARANAALIDYVMEACRASHFVDGSKSSFEITLMQQSDLFDVVPIHLSRDGRGQFHSNMRRRPEIDPAEAARIYKGWIDRISTFLEGWNRPYVRVKYEDLCDRPTEELRRICRELGLDPDLISIDFRNGAQHAIGNGRLFNSTERRIVNPETWRDELSDENLDVFELIAGDANRAVGYAA